MLLHRDEPNVMITGEKILSQHVHFNNANSHDMSEKSMSEKSMSEKRLLVRTQGFITTMLAESGLLVELSEILSKFSLKSLS